jgi:hypothetical protein
VRALSPHEASRIAAELLTLAGQLNGLADLKTRFAACPLVDTLFDRLTSPLEDRLVALLAKDSA